QAGPGLDRAARDRRRDPVLDLRGVRDPEPGGQRGRRPARSAGLDTQQRPGGPGHRRGAAVCRAGPDGDAAPAPGPRPAPGARTRARPPAPAAPAQPALVFFMITKGSLLRRVLKPSRSWVT